MAQTIKDLNTDIVADVAATVPEDVAQQKFQEQFGDSIGTSPGAYEFREPELVSSFEDLSYQNYGINEDYITDIGIDAAAERAVRYHFAMGDTSPGAEQIQNDIIVGREGELRADAVRRKLVEDAEFKTQFIHDLMVNPNYTPDDIKLAEKLAKEGTLRERVSDGTIFEQMATNRLFNTAFASPHDDEALKSVTGPYTESFLDIIERHKTPVEYSLIARRYLEEQSAKVSQMGWGEYVHNFSAYFVPGLAWARLQDISQPDLSGQTSFMLGNNLTDQVRNMYFIEDPVEFERVLKETLEYLNVENPLMALQFANAVMGYGGTEELLDNIGSVLDFAGVVGAAKTIQTTGRTINRTASSIKDSLSLPNTTTFTNLSNLPNANPAYVKAQTLAKINASSNRINPAALAINITNSHNEAMNLMVAQNELQRRANLTHQVQSFDDMLGEVPSIANPSVVLNPANAKPSMNAVAVARIEAKLNQQAADLLTSTMINPVRVDRLSTTQHLVANIEATNDIFARYPSINNNVIDTRYIAPEQTNEGVGGVAVLIGRANGRHFTTRQGAENWMRWYGLSPEDSRVVTTDTGYGIEIFQHISEDLDGIRNAVRISSRHSQPPRPTWLGSFDFLNYFRSKDELVPEALKEDFLSSSLGQQGIIRVIKQVHQSIKDLPGSTVIGSRVLRKDSRRNFETFIARQRDYTNPHTGQHGRYSTSLPEFETDWYAQFGRAPTEQEALAYFTYQQLNDIDFILRNNAIYRDKVRIGMEHFRLPNNLNGFEMPYIEAKQVQSIDWQNQTNAGVLIWNGNTTDQVVSGNPFVATRKNSLNRAQRDAIDSSGAVVLNIRPEVDAQIRAAFDAAGYRLMPDFNINYIVVDTGDVSRRPLPYLQMPYQEGGHRIMASPWKLVQPRISDPLHVGKGRMEHSYYGDTNLFGVNDQESANRLAQGINEARGFYIAGDRQGFDDAILRSGSPLDPADVWNEFETGRLSPNVDILTVPTNDSSWGYHNLQAMRDDNGTILWDGLTKYNNEVHDPYQGQVNLQLALERGDPLSAINNMGSNANPLFHFAQRGELLDPMAALSSALTNVARGRVLDDLKVKSTRDFVEHFADVLDGDLEDLRRNPLQTLINPKWKEEARGPNRSVLAAAKNYRRAVMEFLQIETPFQKNIRAMKQRLSDRIHDIAGRPRIDLSNRFDYLTTSDPLKFMRSAAFDVNLGLFSVPQLILQSSTAVHVFAVEGPVQGSMAAYNSMLYRFAKMRPDMARNIGHYAVGMTPEQFEESFTMMRRLNWDNVGQEQAYLDDMMNGTFVDNHVSQFREAGRKFFQIGETNSRLVAWSAAYRRWRVANPNAPLSEGAAREILNRADLLTLNMTSASAASWQKGPASVPLQFATYTTRLMEQLIPGVSTRLTGREKAQALATYGVMFGIPVGVAGPIGGVWPWYKEIKQGLQERGIDVDESMIAKFFNDGALSMGVEAITGEKQNVPERIGPGGITTFYDMFHNGDKTMWDLATGPSGSVVQEMVKATSPFMYYVAGSFADDDNRFPLTWGDFEGILQVTSSYSNGKRAWIAYNTGMYLTKDGKTLAQDAGAASAFFTFLMGTQPQRVSDAFSMMDSDKDLRDLQQDFTKLIHKEMRLLSQSDDPEQRANHAARVKAYLKAGGYRPDQQIGVISGFAEQYGDIITAADRKFMLQSPEQMDFVFEKAKRRDQ